MLARAHRLLPNSLMAWDVPSLPLSLSTHSPDCAWQWPRRSAAWPRRPWLSPSERAPCSCTWPDGRKERKARRRVKVGGQAGKMTPHLQLESHFYKGMTQTRLLTSLSTHYRAQREAKKYGPDLESDVYSIKSPQIFFNPAPPFYTCYRWGDRIQEVKGSVLSQVQPRGASYSGLRLVQAVGTTVKTMCSRASFAIFQTGLACSH